VTKARKPNNTEKVVAVKPLQVTKLAILLQQRQDAQAMLMTYIQSIADAHGIEEFEDTRLDGDKNTLTFHFKETET